MMKRFVVGVSLMGLVLVAGACGEDDGGPTTSAPSISNAALECGPFAGEGDPRADGDVLLRVAATVTDADGDLGSVTVTYDGAVLAMTDEGDNVFAYNQGGSLNQIARCAGDESVIIRAVDEAGNVTELREDKLR